MSDRWRHMQDNTTHKKSLSPKKQIQLIHTETARQPPKKPVWGGVG
jgi:hypothetical protein